MTPGMEKLYGKVDLAFSATNEPLFPESAHASFSSSMFVRRLRRSREVIALDDMPPIVKSADGKIFWADEQCTRRVDRTTTEARLLLKLLPTDEPESVNYAECKQMFDGFGREQKRLRDLVEGLSWWKWTTWRQKGIWKARIEWLKRMEESRSWLLYLMARRKRIPKQAPVKVLEALKEKRRVKLATAPPRGRTPQQTVITSQPIMLKDITNRMPDTCPQPLLSQLIKRRYPELRIETSQNPEKDVNLAAKPRGSFIVSRNRDSRSRSSRGVFPVLGRSFEATGEDIKRQVEMIIPRPRPYMEFGWFLHSTSDPKERIVQLNNPNQLFQVLRRGGSYVEEWGRSLSLKNLGGFGLYKCEISRGAHIPLALNASSHQAALSQLFLAYKASYRHADLDIAQSCQVMAWILALYVVAAASALIALMAIIGRKAEGYLR
ncbi:hypothetical protein LZ554_000805 [Drepanopeziza brunnea f. sp. 'monogermtubi']|nr:hypothetical protein LZ554_000805 [Drepanopeziza brunnea f. sp. 'monogermtubi']